MTNPQEPAATARAPEGSDQHVTRADLAAHRETIEQMLIERETRIVPIWLNVLNSHRQEGWFGARSQAALKALLWKFLSPTTAAAAALGIGGIVTLVLTWQTTRLMERQNRLLEIQNLLQESSRRAGLTVELTEVLNRINDGKWAPFVSSSPEAPGPTCRQSTYGYSFPLAPGSSGHSLALSEALLGRVVALSNSFKPYRYLDVNKDDLTSDFESGLSAPASPERAQLLLSLASANISLEQVSKAGAIFDKMPMGNTQLAGHRLTNVVADGSDFNGAILAHTNFAGAKLRWSKITEANAVCAQFDNASLTGSDLAEGQFMGATFRGADLSGARIFIAKFEGADFSGADLSGIYTCKNDQPVAVTTRQAFLDEVGTDVKLDDSTKFGPPPNGLPATAACR